MSMINKFKKLASYAFLAGLFFVGYGLWEIYQQRNINQEVVTVEIGELANTGNQLIYATVNGGTVDLANVYEYTIQSRKKKRQLGKTFYTPVIISSTGKVAYILDSEQMPSITDLIGTAHYTGLLRDGSEVPSGLREKFDAAYPNSNYQLLDSSYEPKTLKEKMFDLKDAIALMLGGLIIRLLLNIFNKPAVDEENLQSKQKNKQAA